MTDLFMSRGTPERAGRRHTERTTGAGAASPSSSRRTFAGTAYVASNNYQMEDMRPYIYKTTDYGATWKQITTGKNPGEFVRVVREDPERSGLLYAGTERGVWVSFNDGASWQTLRRNLPLVPIHDLAVKEGDLIAARDIWPVILDSRRFVSVEAVDSGHRKDGRSPLQAAKRLPGELQWWRWNRLGRWASYGTEPAVRRRDLLLAEVAGAR